MGDFLKKAYDNDMKCPFCQQELLLSSYRDGDKDNEIWNCLHCQIGGKRKLWQELIRTRKALEIAVDALNRIDKELMTGIEMAWQARNALEQITALKQKD